jgi:hypothetical protein
MKLNFKIDDEYLIAHTLSSIKDSQFSSKENKDDIVNFQNYAWNKSNSSYNFLIGRPYHLIYIPGSNVLSKNIKKNIEVLENLPDYLNKLKESKEFIKIKKQVEEYLENCIKQWESNYSKTEKIIKDITGFDLDKNFDVYITHPNLKNGRYNYKQNIISWGHNEDFPNYTTIYLWHEILHSYFKYSELEHAVIELITDNELRKQLNNIDYPPFEGHSDLNKIKKDLLSSWKKYLKKDNKNIKEFIKNK